jgi:hypothetical protein
VESHASAAEVRTLAGLGLQARRFATSIDLPICGAVAAALAAAAFVAEGGLQLGSSTAVEVGAIALAAVLVAAAVLTLGFEARLHGGLALASLAALAGLTGLSILWSLHPADSWIETNRTLAYVATFASGIATVRLGRERWPAVLAGVLVALTAVSLYGLATKVAPGWLAPDEVYGRLREPYGYWNAVGVTAAMAMPLALWLGTNEGGHRLVRALAWPLLAVLAVVVLLSFSRGSIVAAVVGTGVWLAIVPRRLPSVAVLLPSIAVAAVTTGWAFSQSALTDDRIALADRKDAGLDLGLILLVAIVLLYAAGVALQLATERRPLAEATRRRIGTAAIAILVASPFIGLGALALTDRGVTGTISDRWHDLTTAKAVTPQNQPSRLTETASVRSIYWKRAIEVWKDHPVAGAGAGSFAQAQLRFRDQPAQAKHAHGYVVQTLADLGLVGLAVSLLALGAWLVSVRQSLELRRGRIWTSAADWPPERVGLAALACVAVAFGVHSTLDWTWFVPAVAMTGLFCAGWVAGRGGLFGPHAGVPPLAAVRVRLPERSVLRRRAALALAIVATAALMITAAVQPWRSHYKGDHSLELAAAGDYAGARAAALDASDADPLSVEPYFDLAAIEDGHGNERGALSALQKTLQLEPASAETWRRLGEYELNVLGRPKEAITVLRGALYLDPLSAETRSSFITALRAETVLERARAPAQQGRGGNSRGPARAAKR